MTTKISWITFILIVLQASSISESNAQSIGYIKGQILNASGEPVPDISVSVSDALMGDVSDKMGKYSIGPIQVGAYVIKASGIGYISQEQNVSVALNGNHIVNFVFQDADILLPGIEVTGRRQDAYTSAYTYFGTRSAIASFEIPQSLSSVTKELMDDQQVFGLAGVMKNIAGVHNNAPLNDIDIRGFRSHTGPSASGYRLINGLRGNFGYFNNPMMVNIERVEVLKGPASALYGSINPGGSVNLVTKKPLATPRKAIQFSTGSFNTIRTAADLTGPLNESGTLLYRFNTGFEKTNTFRDFNDYTAFSVAPTVTFAPSESTVLNAELVYNSFNGFLTRGMAIPAQNLEEIDVASTLAQPSDWYNVEDVYLHMSLHHRLSSDVSINAAYLRFSWGEDLGEHRTLNKWKDTGTQLVSNIRYWERLDQTQTENISGFLTINKDLGSTKHAINLGADWVSFYTDGGTVWEARSKRVPVDRTFTTNTGEVVSVTELTEEPLSFDLLNPVYRHRGNDIANYVFKQNRDIGDREDEYHSTGLFIQDDIALTKRIRALVGLRYELYRDVHDLSVDDSVRAQKQNIFVPRFGIVADLNNQTNLYANFSKGFLPISPSFIHSPEAFRPDNDEGSFEHESSTLMEIGLKSVLLQGGLQASVAVYRILKQNVLQPTGEVNGFGNEVFSQLGEVRSQGVELEVTGRLQQNLLVNFHYAYNPTEITKSEDAQEEGHSLWGAPEQLAGFWARYSFDKGAMNGLGFGAGIYHASARRHRFQSTDLVSRDTFFGEWPAYTRLDAAVYYRVDRFKMAINFNNLLNKKYWVGGFDYLNAHPGAPFHVLTSIGYTF